jgi:CBS domain-containing protein
MTGGAPPRIAGIFTSKDVVLRVIAAGLEASRCSVVRVMTPHPDTAPPTMSVHDALKKMYSACFHNRSARGGTLNSAISWALLESSRGGT